ncbi:TIGR04222 domain-containing membrane protein [Sphingomonas sp. HITSZ_GF]|uniref:TIGR04222 domain-containing membrane protein n=1 Tax=Sphingomonas sp. HITSZ_GF TaxID=3037247 RepID=UPI00240D4F3F|nr:TIGR04222 domain-containing membrane protein [Sphingomonas sp. HITSZ_GF]MDG2532417.1 TIGR04222 domain-containing membrane protein [Sphingomonas sp. HITSZ_GF]
MSPFDLTGGPFLQLYGVLLVLTIIAGFLIPRWLRPEGRTPRRIDTDDLAYLAGGGTRLAETVTARLLAANQLAMDGKSRFTPGTFGIGTPAERSVLALPGGSSWGKVAAAVGKHGGTVRARLVDGDLLMSGGEALQMRFFQTLPYLLLLGFGTAKLLIGEARGRPVGFLTALLVVTAILALIRFVALDRRTRAGRDALADARERSERLRRAPAGGETDLGVALFGTAVLVGSDWGGFHQMRTASSGSDGGSSGDGGGGCGGGGGGGGGCGGCGS